MNPRFSLTKRIASGPPVLLDGATGTELARRGVDLSHPSWTARILIEQPEILSAIHRDYAEAGAEILTANTFRTHARNLQTLGREHEAAELTRLAVNIARQAAGESCWVAGSVAPLEDCYSPLLTPGFPVLRDEHAKMARNLAAAGVDLILIETQVTIREACCAAEGASLTGVPFGVSFVSNASGELLSGELLADAFAALENLNPLFLGVNCLPGEEALPALATCQDVARGIPRCIYGNTGKLTKNGTWELTAGRNPAVYAGYAKDWQHAGIRVIGGCCGTEPAHIAAIHAMLYGNPSAQFS